MSEPRNIAAFDGHSSSSYFTAAKGAQKGGDGWPEFNGGIQIPKRIHLPIGQKYYRFASSRAPREKALSGAWWLDYENFSKISRFVKEKHMTVREAARYFLAIPKDWSDLDLLVSANQMFPMDSYAGEGRKATGSHSADLGSSYIPPQHIKVRQLYIPMLSAIANLEARLAQRRTLRELAFPHPIIENVWKCQKLTG